MDEIAFERECRTPYSEAYSIISGDAPIGRIDLHLTPNVVHATLCIIEAYSTDQIRELIQAFDQDIVGALGVEREELIVHVFQGSELGVFGDHGFQQNGYG